MSLSRPFSRRLAGLAALGLALSTPALLPAAAAYTAAPAAPGAPGVTSYFDLARKDCVGTATGTASKVWYTVADGVLSDVYEPTIDNTDVATLQYLVTDGRTFTDLQTRDMTYTVAADSTGMACTVTATSAAHGYRLVTTYVTDPMRDSVLMGTRLESATSGAPVSGLRLYARLDAHVNGNGGGGSANGGADSAIVDTSTGVSVPVVYDTSTVSQAANRDYAVPTFMALHATRLAQSSVGFAGTASDGLTQLDSSRTLTTYTSAAGGHITATEDVTPGPDGKVTLALGFGRTLAQAVGTASASLGLPFPAVEQAYRAGWTAYDSGLKPPPAALPGLNSQQSQQARAAYWLDANVLKSSEDKTFPGAIVASLASPWGQAVSAGATVNGKPVYFGSYREVFARDLYEAFTGLLADGDLATAQAATRFLLQRQQLPNGELPRNSLVNGAPAPDTGGDQLDETAYPILMADLSGLGGDANLWSKHIKPAADFLLAHGPSYGVERWEEQSGFSPSTIAAEIAGLTAAADIAAHQGDPADARLYQAAADDFQRSVKTWAVTTTGPDSSSPYFIRLSRSGDPNAATGYNLGNGGPTVDQRAVIDGGFQELIRLGELPANDTVVADSLAVLDKQISVQTPTGVGYYRYGTSAASGSADGYGDCYQPSQTSCTTPGEPWPTTDVGTGHLWPVLSGERAESDLANGDPAGASRLLESMIGASSGVGLVPEQEWEDPALTASPFGTDPTIASIGFIPGHAAGSASPLTWAQAQELRLIADLGAGSVTDRPAITSDRYLTKPPAAAPLTLTAPTPGSTIEGTSTTVTGTTSPGAAVTIQDSPTDTGAAASTVTATADATGAFSAAVPIGFGTNVLSVSATGVDGSTGYAQTSVIGDLVGGTTVLDTSDPVGDDNGPGTYTYPTASAFSAGSFDLTRFQVITANGTVYLRTTLANLQPTFGNTMGAQMLDIYVHNPAAAGTSTAAAFPSRNYTIAPADAWSQRLEIQGFAAPVWVDSSGNPVGRPSAVVASTLGKTITIALPQAAFGTPASGWSFAVVLTGQDGFSPDQARAFTPTAGAYTFGVCPAGGTAPICSFDPNAVPKAMDVLTPPGVDQKLELDPTRGPVVIAAVKAP